MPRNALAVVSRLLEDERDLVPDDDDDEGSIKDLAFDALDDEVVRSRQEAEQRAKQRKQEAIITPENAMTVSRFFHRTHRYRSGEPYMARRNGRTQVWKSRPGEFRIPIKVGLRSYGNITHTNAHEWAANPDFE